MKVEISYDGVEQIAVNIDEITKNIRTIFENLKASSDSIVNNEYYYGYGADKYKKKFDDLANDNFDEITNELVACSQFLRSVVTVYKQLDNVAINSVGTN